MNIHERSNPHQAKAPLLSLGILLLLVALVLAISSPGLLPITLALLGASAAVALLRQATVKVQPKTVTV